MSIAQKAATLREQLGLESGLPLVEIVETATFQLGIKDVAQMNMVQKIDACLSALGVAVPAQKEIPVGLIVAPTPEIIPRQAPHVAVPYSRLAISSATRVHSREEARYLFDEATSGPSAFGTSKWNAATRGPVTLEITVGSGPPIRLSHFALKSANDCPARDPKTWSLVAVRDDGSEATLHSMNDHSAKWGGRWQWREWPVTHDFAASRFLLRIHTNHGDGGCTQLGQMRLFEWGEPGAATAAPMASGGNFERPRTTSVPVPAVGLLATEQLDGCFVCCCFPLGPGFYMSKADGPNNKMDTVFWLPLPIPVPDYRERVPGTNNFRKPEDHNSVDTYSSDRCLATSQPYATCGFRIC